MNVTVARASPDDARDILALQRLAYQSEAALYDDLGIPPLTQTLDELGAEFGDHVFLTALLDGRIVGSVRASQADGTCRIGRLVVDPDLQGHGIGTRLMREIEDRFSHVERFELFTGHKSERNLALYSRLGYAHDRSERVNDGLTLVYLAKRTHTHRQTAASMRAVLFDIDGTLIHSNALDDKAYAHAIREVLGPVRLRPSWSQYTNVSGSGTLLEILGDNGIGDTEGALRAVEEAFVAWVARHVDEHGPVPEVPGARDFVQRLADSEDCQIGYATAGFLGSARFKLESSRFPVDGVPLASCNDHVDKASIMTHALAQLDGPFESITYYGDGEWDRLASQTLGWDFVPVGEKLNGLRHF